MRVRMTVTCCAVSGCWRPWQYDVPNGWPDLHLADFLSTEGWTEGNELCPFCSEKRACSVLNTPRKKEVAS